MKKLIKSSLLIAIFGFIGVLTLLITSNGFDRSPTDKPILAVSTALAAENELKAGMNDPKTGKNIKYWTAPMDPTYIRNESGKSPLGMDLVPVYEEEGDEKESASTIRIDPGTIQNMGVRMGRVERKQLVK